MSHLSVILPVYNVAPFLEEALDSLLGQTHQDHEIVAVDDASTDESPAILARRARRDPRLRIVRHPENRGLSAALNTALEHARHKFALRADPDDTYFPDWMAALHAAAHTHKDAAIIGTALVTSRGARYDSPPDDAGIRARLLWRVPFNHATVLFNRELLGASLRYDESYRTCEDLELWHRLCFLRGFQGLNLGEALMCYRIRGDSLSNRIDAQLVTHERRFDRLLGKFLGLRIERDVGFAIRRSNRLAGAPPASLFAHIARVTRRARELGLVPEPALRAEASLTWRRALTGCSKKSLLRTAHRVTPALAAAWMTVHLPGRAGRR